MPDKCYTISQASRELPDILQFVEEGHAVELTRHGESVAVLISMTEYRTTHASPQGDFWQALQQFRERYADDLFDLSDALADARDTSPGRDMSW